MSDPSLSPPTEATADDCHYELDTANSLRRNPLTEHPVSDPPLISTKGTTKGPHHKPDSTSDFLFKFPTGDPPRGTEHSPKDCITFHPPTRNLSMDKLTSSSADNRSHQPTLNRDEKLRHSMITCQEPRCSFSCRTIRQLRKHLSTAHRIKMECENLTFITNEGMLYQGLVVVNNTCNIVSANGK